MAIFLTRDQVYRLLQRELPDGVYPDGPPSAFFSTADMASVADTVASAYSNLNIIYDNYFPATTDASVDKWLAKMFVGTSFDTSVTLQDKRNRIIAKVRKQPKINLWEILTLAAGFVPAGKYVQIIERCSSMGQWILGKSRLGRDTRLAPNFTYNDLLALGIIQNGDWCGFLSTRRAWKLGASKLGTNTYLAAVSFQQIIFPQIQAYGYDLNIFDYQVTGTSFTQLINALNQSEPARSVRFIHQPVSLSGAGFTKTVTNVGELSGVHCITIDTTSQTGYSGLI